MANERSYYNRKKYRSIVAIAVCDALLRFRFLDSSCAGSTHDSTATDQCGLYQIVFDFLPPGFFLVADAAFAISTRIMTPFRRNALVDSEPRRRFNLHLSRARVTVERAFGLLKGRWRCLRCLRCDLMNSGRYIACCMVLHNLCIDRQDVCADEFFDSIEEEERRARDEPDVDEDAIHPADVMDLPAAGYVLRSTDGSEMRSRLVRDLLS